MRKRILFIVIGILITAFMISYGIKLKEFLEVEINANILCLSCIGIG